MESEEEEEFPPLIYEESFVETSGGASADRPQSAGGMWCSAPWLAFGLISFCLPASAGATGLDHDPEEVAQPALNGDHGSARHGGFYIDDRYGVDITAPLHRTDKHGIADIFTRPLPPQALFYDNSSFYGIEPNSEGSDTDSGYGSDMDEVD
ncbi:hypothetical protein CYMTET_57072 [Cymbomonas tetramitiformis]|uniref:Uncharacterized protein n=1 Tax=Cymbomonas tetramitiformis TaxID=36881 RepID=A0AAE0EL69_9CHLO|nr:hypothetical protein CYMTET_57072 [Cymbomonas tetramitiformis]